MYKIISVISCKGGVGKTTSTVCRTGTLPNQTKHHYQNLHILFSNWNQQNPHKNSEHILDTLFHRILIQHYSLYPRSSQRDPQTKWDSHWHTYTDSSWSNRLYFHQLHPHSWTASSPDCKISSACTAVHSDPSIRHTVRCTRRSVYCRRFNTKGRGNSLPLLDTICLFLLP